MKCSNTVVRGAVGNLRRAMGMARDVMKQIESAVLEEGKGAVEMPIWSKVGAPMFEATRKARIWRAELSSQLEKTAKNMSAGDQENILSYLLNPEKAGQLGFNLTAGQMKSARELRALMVKALTDGGGLTKELAEQFISRDLMNLRKAGGDVARLGGAWNIYPKSFQPFMEDIMKGELSAATNNAYGLTWEIINMGQRARFLRPVHQQVKKEIASWSHNLRGKLSKDDITFAQHIANEFADHNLQMRPETQSVIAGHINTVVKRINSVLGKGNELQLTDETISRWAANMTSWYGGLAMSMRPALAVRNMSQVLLPATKVGYKRLGKALTEVYGPNRKELIGRALKDLGIPAEGEQAILFNEGAGGQLGKKFWRTIKNLQNQGLRPYRWADRVNNRVTTYRMGELAVLEEGALLQSGKINTEQFLFRTGLKGSPKVDQQKVLSLLRGKELDGLSQAAREYGKILVEDTQFIYDGVNSPMFFKSGLGRLFGQFGVWPISFTEFMYQNTMQRDAAWVQKFLGNYGVQKMGLVGLGMATGIDTSSWNYANPLTFQGGPWFQAMRDASILGTSLNEFERREARTNLSRMWGRMGTPAAGIMNPFGAATVDILQARAAENPLDAALLGFGFNLRDVSPATSR